MIDDDVDQYHRRPVRVLEVQEFLELETVSGVLDAQNIGDAAFMALLELLPHLRRIEHYAGADVGEDRRADLPGVPEKVFEGVGAGFQAAFFRK